MSTTTANNCVPTRLAPAGFKLASLEPVALLPERYTERPQALTALQSVESVEIRGTRKRNGGSQKVFVLDVCLKQSRRRIPVVSTRAVCSRPATTTHGCDAPPSPDRQVERTFSEIRWLRDDVYYAADKDHGLSPCAYCRAISDLILLNATTPYTAMKWFKNEDAQCTALTSFVQQLLRLAVQAKDTQPCRGQQRIPQIVSEFLQLSAPSPQSPAI